jgi:hypothetical protein
VRCSRRLAQLRWIDAQCLGNIIVLMIFQLARALFVAEPGIGFP